jgi:hypothetical protein
MDLSSKKRHELVEIAKDLGIDGLFGMRVQEIIEEIKKKRRFGGSKKGSFIYVLVSSEKPNLIKIGITNRDPETRAKELTNSTGVAMPFIVAYQAPTDNPEKVEKAVHDRLSEKRVNSNREFFRVKLRRAIAIIEEEV